MNPFQFEISILNKQNVAKINISIFIFLVFGLFNGLAQKTGSIYTVTTSPWEESLGNHRAILNIEKAAEAIHLDITWRRHDADIEARKFLVIEAVTGDTISNIYRLNISNERCELVFGPVKNPGIYYFYYLPYIVQENYGFYNKGYLIREDAPDKKWLKKKAAKIKRLPYAKLIEFQARTAFDSFFPMEVIALKSEKTTLKQQFPDDFLIFPESREFPIRMLDDIPLKWIETGPSNTFSGQAYKNEYYAFQLGIYASNESLEDIKLQFSDLKNGSRIIPSSLLTCFNTGGTDPYGIPFNQRVDVALGNVQPLWIGVDIPKDIASGTYSGQINVTAKNTELQTVDFRLNIKDDILADRGDQEPWRHSRLRWLNSTLGINNNPTKAYNPIISTDDLTYDLSGKTLELDHALMPKSLNVYGNNILQDPISFVVETSNGVNVFSPAEHRNLLKEESGIISASWESLADNLSISGIGILEADGYLNYKLTLKAGKDIQLENVRLEIPFNNDIARYMMGMGLPGTNVPSQHAAKWEGPHDSFWIGNEKGGLWCELRGSDYHGPLLNLYHPEYPASWYNEDLGGFRIEKNNHATKAIVYSGKRNLAAGEEIEFEWSFLMTPVKKIDYRSQFVDRYYHNGGDPVPSEEDLASGVKIVNLHHANKFNPHINYPFVAVDEMKNFVDDMHQKGQKVKIYYTIRELTNYTTEIWALRSLGHEILGNGKGGGYPWLREHLVDGYRPQWYQYFPNKSADASIVNAPGDSRWYNYYIEGLAWLIRNVDIDGLYLDDVSYDRRILKRIRKVLDNEKPGCLLDLHSNTGFSKGPATQYAEFFPFVDKLWFGESFKYDQMPPENWLVEVSGIPFGHMGDMLHAGGNRWLGMLFGMTVRHPWYTEGVICDPRPIWKIWDEFGIQEAKMIGFWEDHPLVTTDNEKVKATAYLKEGKLLISIGNFSDQAQQVRLYIDWKKAGINKSEIHLVCPAIKDFQIFKEFKDGQIITVEPRKGWLIMTK